MHCDQLKDFIDTFFSETASLWSWIDASSERKITILLIFFLSCAAGPAWLARRPAASSKVNIAPYTRSERPIETLATWC